MFKRFVNWIRARRGPQIPDNARYVVETGGPRGSRSRLTLVVPAESGVVVEPVRRLEGRRTMSRQDWLNEYGEKPAARRARNRAWMVDYLPDECLFR